MNAVLHLCLYIRRQSHDFAAQSLLLLFAKTDLPSSSAFSHDLEALHMVVDDLINKCALPNYSFRKHQIIVAAACSSFPDKVTGATDFPGSGAILSCKEGRSFYTRIPSTAQES